MGPDQPRALALNTNIKEFVAVDSGSVSKNNPMQVLAGHQYYNIFHYVFFLKFDLKKYRIRCAIGGCREAGSSRRRGRRREMGGNAGEEDELTSKAWVAIQLRGR